MKTILIGAVLVLALGEAVWGQAPAWKAGLAKVKITPEKPLWMTGFGARTHPSTGTLHDLYAKALALDDGSGRAGVLVTADLLGFAAETSSAIAQEVEKRYGIPRNRIVFSASHTHCGPGLTYPHRLLYGARATAEECRDSDEYTTGLQEKVVAVVGAALKEMRPARLRMGHGKAEFAVNRRLKTEKGFAISVNPAGPVDHDVPVLAVESADGQLMVMVFGYACHNTTLGGDIYQFNGDYAGFAQLALEKAHPQAMAMFVEGCGADINPAPRGTVELAQRYGEALAGAVEKAMGGTMKPVTGPLRSSYAVFPIAFDKLPTRAALETQLQNKDIYQQWQARELLKAMDRDGKLAGEYPYTLQVWQFGRDLTFIAMAGEVVVDYDLRLKKELGAENLWVAGYCNDVFAYIPSVRVLQEGGYEAAGAMVYYCQPGAFAPSVEETIVGKARQLVTEARVK